MHIVKPRHQHRKQHPNAVNVLYVLRVNQNTPSVSNYTYENSLIPSYKVKRNAPVSSAVFEPVAARANHRLDQRERGIDPEA